jgi:hypothetical protein
VCLASGRLAQARASVEESLALRRELGDSRGEAWMLERLARVSLAQGDRDTAESARNEAAVIATAIDDGALHAALAPSEWPPSLAAIAATTLPDP